MDIVAFLLVVGDDRQLLVDIVAFTSWFVDKDRLLSTFRCLSYSRCGNASLLLDEVTYMYEYMHMDHILN